jgi:hypothetical protein
MKTASCPTGLNTEIELTVKRLAHAAGTNGMRPRLGRIARIRRGWIPMREFREGMRLAKK